MQAMYPNGDIYVGQQKNGIKKGRGSYHYIQDRIKYTGDWVDNKKVGKGEMIFENDNNATIIGRF